MFTADLLGVDGEMLVSASAPRRSRVRLIVTVRLDRGTVGTVAGAPDAARRAGPHARRTRSPAGAGRTAPRRCSTRTMTAIDAPAMTS